MKSIDFLTNHFKSYYPNDFFIYSSFFFLLKKSEVTNEIDLKTRLSDIENRINKNDMKLLCDFSADYKEQNYLVKIMFLLLKIFASSIYEEIIQKEIYRLKYYKQNIDEEDSYEIFKYYFPYEHNTSHPYARFKPIIYYCIRKELLLCNSYSEIIKKLKYDEQFKSFITNTVAETNKSSIVKHSFSDFVNQVCNELLFFLGKNTKEQKDYYYKLIDSYERYLNKELGLKAIN